jgi:hypothetical protein
VQQGRAGAPYGSGPSYGSPSTNPAGQTLGGGSRAAATAPAMPTPDAAVPGVQRQQQPTAPATQLTVVITRSTVPGHNGRFTLTCHPAGGTHPDPVNACAKLDQLAGSGTDPFAPASGNQMCSMISGGPAAARITGIWQGRRVDAEFTRTNSCQISRWNNLMPLLSPESAT